MDINEDNNSDSEEGNDFSNCRYLKSKNFILGTAICAAQTEGSRYERGDSIWDAFCSIPGNIRDGSNLDITCDFHNRYKQDIQTMVKLGYKHLRLSISWPRIMKDGRSVNQEGIDFYNELFNELIKNDITPYVTLYHWDYPLYLYQEYRGWLDRQSIKDFFNYAKVCFQSFPQIKFWITHNEPWCVSILGYTTGEQAPGYRKDPGYAPYIVAHNLLLSHGKVVKYYRQNYDGKIGLTLNTNMWIPITNHPEDVEAANRAMDFMFGWFYNVLINGDYPETMKQRVGDRLPKFTEKQKQLLKGSIDFTGLNYYNSLVCGKTTFIRFIANVYQFLGMRDFFTMVMKDHYYTDMNVMCFRDPGETTQMGWNIHPEGLYLLIKYIYDNYNVKGSVYIFENGIATENDQKRIQFVRSHLDELVKAKKDGYDIQGYFYWSLISNWEWAYGYTVDFGLIGCDFETQQRTIKDSALWYSKYIAGECQRASGESQ